MSTSTLVLIIHIDNNFRQLLDLPAAKSDRYPLNFKTDLNAPPPVRNRNTFPRSSNTQSRPNTEHRPYCTEQC